MNIKRVYFGSKTGPQSGLLFGDPEKRPRMVFVHANGMSARAYRPLLEPVAEQSGKTILALDLRGHGRSGLAPLTPKTANWWRLAEDYKAALEGLQLNDISLAGHSIGASLSLMTAAIAPERVRNLCLLEPVLLPNWFHLCANTPILDQVSRLHPMVRRAMSRQSVFSSINHAREKWAHAKVFRNWAPGFFEAYLEGALSKTNETCYALNGPPEFEAQCFRQLRFWPRPVVKLVDQPTRIYLAEFGSTTKTGMRKFISRNCPSFSVEIVQGAGHFLPMQKPDFTVKQILATLYSAHVSNEVGTAP